MGNGNGRVEFGVDERVSEGRRWWQTCGTSFFENKIAEMPVGELIVLKAEIEGVCGTIVAHIESGSTDKHPTWSRARALRARAYVLEKKKIIKAELFRRQKTPEEKERKERERLARHAERMRQREEALGRVRQVLASGDVAGALLALIDELERRNKE